MKKTAIVYSFNSSFTSKVAEQIYDIIGNNNIEKVNIEDITEEKFLAYDVIIAGSSTWFDGELPNYWDEFVPAIEDMDLNGKVIGVFGIGNQKQYPENFADAVGILADLFKKRGANLVGQQKVKGFTFESSRALINKNTFAGLVLDTQTQADLNEERIKSWLVDMKEYL